MTGIVKYLLSALMGVLLLACAQQDDHQTGADGGDGNRVKRLLIGTVMEISDTGFFDHGLERLRFTLSHHGLVRFDKDGRIIPALAESWNSTDLRRWTFHLRKTATWHDGVPVTSGDIVYTIGFSRKHDPSWESVYGDIVSVEAPDPHTVVIELRGPDYNFLTTIAVLMPVPKHVFEHVEDPKRYNDKRALVGTGPYAFERFDRQAGVVKFAAFDGYWGGRPRIDTLELRLFKNPETMMMAFRKGEIDAPYIYAKGVSYYYLPALRKNPNVDHMIVLGGGLGNVLWINNSRKPLSDAGFRRALSYTVNYEELRELFTAGLGSIPDAGFVLEGIPGYVKTRKMAFDVQKARSVLEGAGYRDLDGDGRREAPDGSPIRLTLVASSALPDQARLSEMLKGYLADAGVSVNLKLVDTTTFSTIMDTDKSFDLAIYGTTRWGMSMGSGYGSGYVDAQYYGWSVVTDPEYQAFVDELKTTGDEDRRRQLATQVQHYYADEMTQIPLYTMPIIQPYSRNYEGWTYSAYTGLLCPETFYNLRRTGSSSCAQPRQGECFVRSLSGTGPSRRIEPLRQTCP